MKTVTTWRGDAPATGQADATIDQARQLRRTDPSAALVLARCALDAAQGGQDARATAACQLLCAELLYDLSDFGPSCALGAQALEGFERLGDAAGRIDSLRALGRNHEKQGNDEQALAFLSQALDVSTQAGDDRRAAYALLSMGHLRHNAGDFGGAIERYRQAQARAQAVGDAHVLGLVESGLANGFARMGDYARALAHHHNCLAQFDELRYPSERSFILNNIANVHFALEDHRSAIDLHVQSLAIKRRQQDRWGEGTSLQGLGDCCVALGEFEQAQAHFEAALRIAEEVGDREGECINHQSLGDLALKQGRLDEAVRHYETGLRWSHELGRRYAEVTLQLGLGRAHRMKGDLLRAQACLQAALHAAEAAQVRREVRQVHEELAAVAEARGDLGAALVHVKQAFRLEREIFGEDLEARLRNLKLHVELERAEQEKEQHRLRHAELARVNEALERSNAELAQANAQKEKLLVALERQKRQLQRQSTHDALTGLANRRLFDQELARAFRSSKRYGQALSVVICDIDNFKSINDRFSHPTGDAVLQTIARLLTRYGRKSDLIARYGGEEFALLLTNTPAHQAFGACDKIRRVIAEHPWHTLHPELVVTLSMGIADDLSPDSHALLMALADKHLYRAKHGGKNQVVMSS